MHASPRDPVFEYILDGYTALANLALLDGGVCFHGHTHIPGVFSTVEGRVQHEYALAKVGLEGPALVNPGSVGQPRDGDPEASYGIWDVTDGTFSFRRVAYDVHGAQRAIREAGLTPFFAERLAYGR